MICPACGGENRPGSRFCRHCGGPLEAREPAVQEAAPRPEGPEGAVAGPRPEEPEGGTEVAAAEVAPGTVETAPEGAVAAEAAEVAVAAAEAPEPVRSVEAPEPAEPAAPAEPAPAPLLPLVPGTVVAGRYLVIEAESVEPDEVLYAARDLCRCPQCCFDGNSADDAFCARCGAAADRRPLVRLVQVRESGASPSSGEEASARLEHEGLHFLVLRQAGPQPPTPAPAAVRRLIAGHRSDVGQVRDVNEDSLLLLALEPVFQSQAQPLLHLCVVADGMGGHEAGEIASRLALQVVGEQVARRILLPALDGEAMPDEEVVVRLRAALEAANDTVFLARQKRDTDMGTTLTAALFYDTRLVLAHVGDCRAYRWGAEGLAQLTQDHSVIASLVAAGRAAPEEVYTHPQRSVVFRCVGDRPTVDVDTAVLEARVGDRLVLCSDGLWEMLRSEGIADVLMQEADPQAACDLLVQRANAAGGDDNISVIVVEVRDR